MYVWSQKHSKSNIDQPGKVANPALIVVTWTGKMKSSLFAPEN